MALLNRFKEYVTEQQLFVPDDSLLIAVSGGVDSIALCELCYLAGYTFTMAHCNFQLREAESDRDEEFVIEIARKYGVRILTKKFETLSFAASQKCSIQVAARKLRYEWFNEILETRKKLNENQLTPRYILTAHHANDNTETVLMNLFKCTGISGMRGILPKANNIVRPLLFAHKQSIIDFAQQRALSYREDSSNTSDKYSRNYIRHHVIPAIEAAYPHASSNINNTIPHLRDAEILYNQAIEFHKKKLIEYKSGEASIPILKLSKASPLKTIIFEIAKEYGFTPAQTDEIVKLMHSETGKYITSATHRILKNRNRLIISSLQPDLPGLILIEKQDELALFQNGKITVAAREMKPGKISPDLNTANLDAHYISFPLLIRKWKQGDYFYPLGMPKKKKIARFLIDKKLSLSDKEKIWVVESNKKILWVINHRIDDRFKITDKTKKILQIKFEPG
ncbi:MAG: tRNA lysidine(34) synthetase TilS [Chitinophagaceae bacterium]|nr:tRNA lysidine(34) synthetase TilS [Chitinophagaceae bacterium]